MCSICIFLDHGLLNGVQLLLVPSDGAVYLVIEMQKWALQNPRELKLGQFAYFLIVFALGPVPFTTSAIRRGCKFTKRNANMGLGEAGTSQRGQT